MTSRVERKLNPFSAVVAFFRDRKPIAFEFGSLVTFFFFFFKCLLVKFAFALHALFFLLRELGAFPAALHGTVWHRRTRLQVGGGEDWWFVNCHLFGNGGVVDLALQAWV